MSKPGSMTSKLAKRTGEELRRILASIPEGCSTVKIYPETLNFCECYLLAQAIRAHFPPTAQFEVRAEQEARSVSADAIDVDFVHKLAANSIGSGAELISVESTLYLAIHRDDLYTVLAGSNEFMRSAIPFPDDIWDTYFEQFMWKYEAEFEVVLSEFRAWLSRRKIGSEAENR